MVINELLDIVVERHGGILVAVHKSLKSSLLSIGKISESIFVNITVANTNYLLAGLYLPPLLASDVFDEYLCWIRTL